MTQPTPGCAGPRATGPAKRLLLTAVLVAGAWVSGASAAESPFNIDWQPPAFTLDTAAGAPFRYPEDLRQPTIVLFWATWCPFCKALMPHLQSILDERGESVRVIALNFREDEDPAAFMADNGFGFDLLPSAEAVADSWGVEGTPGLFLARADGQVVFSLRAIPRDQYPAFEVRDEKRRRTQMAARMSPFWAARLRQALDALEPETR